jgi:hypothetical protein
VEPPPPDDLDAADLAVIDGVAADLDWARRPGTAAEVLSVGDDQVGRAISYRPARFRPDGAQRRRQQMVDPLEIQPDSRNATRSTLAAEAQIRVFGLSPYRRKGLFLHRQGTVP